MSKTGGAAFPKTGTDYTFAQDGMTLRDYFAGQALQNEVLCTGSAPEWQLKLWFGENATAIRKEDIAARQAYMVADAMLKAREMER